ncbi:MAG: sporulation protein [Micromonosporaceae bacterium]
MVFKKLLKAMGVGGPSVETVLPNPNVRPGEALQGEIHLIGGDHSSDISNVSVALVTEVEHESGDYEGRSTRTFAEVPVSGAFTLAPGTRHQFSFNMQVPWENPLTHVYGQPLRGMTMGLSTRLAVAKAVDATDLDPVAVHPLPAQERLLEAFSRLGFHFRTADVEEGRIRGVNQTLPFYQEIEFAPAPQFANAMNQLEVTFVANPQHMDMVLELDKRGGMLTEGHDAFGLFRVDYASAGQTNWETQLDSWLQEACKRRGLFF